VSIPAGWDGVQAQKAWDGKAKLSSESPEVDQWTSPAPASSWALATPSTQELDAFTASMIATNARDHGDTCPAKPEKTVPITVGGGPGTLLAYNCGILINLAAAVHNGVGYQFGFRDPAVHAATDPKDESTFLAILASMQFPD
jgi:hypothetical protein